MFTENSLRSNIWRTRWGRLLVHDCGHEETGIFMVMFCYSITGGIDVIIVSFGFFSFCFRVLVWSWTGMWSVCRNRHEHTTFAGAADNHLAGAAVAPA